MSTPLNKLCELIVDCPHSTAPDEGEGYPLVRTPNIGPGYLDLTDVHRVSQEVYDIRNARAVPQPMDLILAREAPAGNVGIIREGQWVCLGQRTVLIRPDQKKVDPWFLNYYLNAPRQRYRLLSNANGATVSHVNMPIIRNLPIDLPSMEAQQRIASILMAYDNLIENNRRQIALLEEAARRLYKEWFVDLRFPGHESIGIANGIPNGWRKGTLGEVLEVRNGKDHKALADGSIPVYGSGGLMRYCCDFLYQGESVLIPRKGTLNNVMYVNESFWTVDTLFYTHVTLRFGAKYLYQAVRRYDLASMNIGAAVPSMTKAILNKLEVLIPSQDILEQHEAIVAPLFEERDCLRGQIAAAREARDRLLPKLMSGEIEVGDFVDSVCSIPNSAVSTAKSR